ncbi:MAG: hypothetical protein JWP84_3110 [Tardiphaga sp.]|nr:hypothetical protein [Tardiphaga sp.]
MQNVIPSADMKVMIYFYAILLMNIFNIYG